MKPKYFKRVKLAKGLHIELSLDKTPEPGDELEFRAEWDPAIPSDPTPKMLTRYRAGRDALLSRVAEDMGGLIALVEEQ